MNSIVRDVARDLWHFFFTGMALVFAVVNAVHYANGDGVWWEVGALIWAFVFVANVKKEVS